MNVANEKQIGGDHYQATIQVWDFIELNGIGFVEGNAIKYVSRWRKKGKDAAARRQDLEKALHYVEKLIELVRSGVRQAERNRYDINKLIEIVRTDTKPTTDVLYYVNKIMRFIKGHSITKSAIGDLVSWNEFVEENDLNQLEKLVISTIALWQNEFDLRHARDGIELLMSAPEAIS